MPKSNEKRKRTPDSIKTFNKMMEWFKQNEQAANECAQYCGIPPKRLKNMKPTNIVRSYFKRKIVKDVMKKGYGTEYTGRMVAKAFLNKEAIEANDGYWESLEELCNKYQD